ncbi:hypothetical protein SIN8267_01358 [Sinobacterium norvegicum]|uniref:Uncharacterized protein n=1 Tax=Sinobacterium norvegicum TaxID=1641715 RepID=A0ABM9ADY6_9GAMM|nr:hypothetical protein SIN8267_01358 [Sinobacterium norvegicum]
MTKARYFIACVFSLLAIMFTAHLITNERSQYLSIENKKLHCSGRTCSYIVNVLNTSENTQNGVLIIKAYAERDLPKGAKTQDLVASTSVEFNLQSSKSVNITGSLKAPIKPTSIGAYINAIQ